MLTDINLRSILFKDAALLCGYDEKIAEKVNICRQKNILIESGSSEEKVLNKYEEILRINNSIDYDDQILLAVKILSNNEEVRKTFSQITKHLLVDEYQDINAGQRDLISLLSLGQEQGLFVVGDDDQSIYSFRGGTPEYIRQFHKDYSKNGKIMCLTESRRCPDKVIYA